MDHVISCRRGGFHTLWHNEIRDLLAGLFREVCHDVSVEPCLQPLTGEQFPASTNKSDEARLDIRARGFWGTGRGQQDAFCDVRVFYPFASSYQNSRLPTLCRQHESQKRLLYGLRVREVERGCFTPLVFTTGGGMAPEATVCLKRLASMLSDKREESYSTVMGWLRCAFSFSLLRSSLACLRGSTKSSKGQTPCEATASARLWTSLHHTPTHFIDLPFILPFISHRFPFSLCSDLFSFFCSHLQFFLLLSFLFCINSSFPSSTLRLIVVSLSCFVNKVEKKY